MGSVLAGSVFGDHCSPISDTTVLSALATRCPIETHIKTQIPYAVVVCAISILVGTLPTATEAIYSHLFALPLGTAVIWGTVYLLGSPVPNYRPDDDDESKRASISRGGGHVSVYSNQE